jgi:hypothetical protein
VIGSRCFLVGLYAGLLVFLVVTRTTQAGADGPLEYLTNIYLILAAVGGAIGIVRIVNVKFIEKRNIDVSPVWFCLGLILWASGQTAWLIYNFVDGRAVPYPSIADLFYLGNLACWTIGLSALCRHLGLIPLQAFIAPSAFLIAFWAGAWVFVSEVHKTNPVMTSEVIDFMYLFFNFSDIVIAAWLVLGPVPPQMKTIRPLLGLVFFGAVLDLFANGGFIMTATLPPKDPFSYHNGGLIDQIFMTAMLIWSLVVVSYPVGAPGCIPTAVAPGGMEESG